MIPKWSENDLKMIPKWSQTDLNMSRTCYQNETNMISNKSQSDTKMIPKWSHNDFNIIQEWCLKRFRETLGHNVFAEAVQDDFGKFEKEWKIPKWIFDDPKAWTAPVSMKKSLEKLIFMDFDFEMKANTS